MKRERRERRERERRERKIGEGEKRFFLGGEKREINNYTPYIFLGTFNLSSEAGSEGPRSRAREARARERERTKNRPPTESALWHTPLFVASD